MSFDKDKRIRIKDKVSGVVRYIGPVEGKSGEWVGIELDEPVGSNDGSYAGKQYFRCAQKHGVFIRTTRLFPIADHEQQNWLEKNSASYILLDKDGQCYARGSGWERETMMMEGIGNASGIMEGSLWDEDERQERQQLKTKDENRIGREEEEKKKTECDTMRRAAVLALESLRKIKRDLERLQKRMEVVRPVMVSRQERRRVQDLVLKICQANEEKKYAEAHHALAEFKKIMERYRIVVEE